MVVYGIPVWSMAPDIAHRRRGSEAVVRPSECLRSLGGRSQSRALERQLVGATTHEPPMEMDGLDRAIRTGGRGLRAVSSSCAASRRGQFDASMKPPASRSNQRTGRSVGRGGTPHGDAQSGWRTLQPRMQSKPTVSSVRRTPEWRTPNRGISPVDTGAWAPVSTFASHGRTRITTVAGKDLRPT